MQSSTTGQSSAVVKVCVNNILSEFTGNGDRENKCLLAPVFFIAVPINRI